MELERIWESIKETARRHARNKHRLSREEAERVVESICVTEGRLSLPRDAVEYYARELMRLTGEKTP
jgi:hypothetical protein